MTGDCLSVIILRMVKPDDTDPIIAIPDFVITACISFITEDYKMTAVSQRQPLFIIRF